VNDSQDSADVDLDATKQKLSEGLKSCHSVVKDYRSMLEGEAAAIDGDSEGEKASD
jgi:hypothetical protein